MGKTDITHKSFFENAVRFADLMNGAYFGGDKIVEAKDLLPEDGAIQKADEEAVFERLRDVVKKQTKDGSIFAVYVLENQVTVDYGMLIRIMVEESLAYEKQIKDIRRRNKERLGNVLKEDEFLCGFRKTDRLYPVYTLVLYWGDREWDASNSLQDMIDIPVGDWNLERKLKKLLPEYRIHLYDLNRIKDFSGFQTDLRTLFEFYSHRKDKDALREYMDTHVEEVRHLDKESRFLLATMLKEKRLMKWLLKQSEQGKEEEGNVCKAIDDMIEEGRLEGLTAGKVEGSLNTLRCLVHKGLISMETAATEFGVTVSKLEELFRKQEIA